MASPRSLLLFSFLLCFLSAAFAMPFLPDPEDDENENEMDAGKFEYNNENIPDDEEVLKVSNEDEIAFKDKDEDEELDAEEEEEEEKEEEIEEEEDEEKEEEEEEDKIIHEEIAKEEAIDEEIAKEEAVDEEIAKDDEEEILKEDYHRAHEEIGDKGEKEDVFPHGDADEEEVEKPGFFGNLYERAKQLLKKLRGHH